MLQSIEINGLRGIREGKLEGLSRLTVLVGPNGCGKSTILDALLIGACPDYHNGLRLAIQRHPQLAASPRWLFWGGKTGGKATILAAKRGPQRTTTLEYVQHGLNISVQGAGYTNPPPGVLLPTKDENIILGRIENPRWIPELRLVETGLRGPLRPLHQSYTEAVEQGRRNEAIGIVTDAISGATNVEILTEGNQPVLHVVFPEGSVPAEYAGDGSYALTRLSLEMAARPDGVVLLEEPEVHQHPGAIVRSARVIRAATRRGIQVILATHSLELIDALLADTGKQELNDFALFRLKLEKGKLESQRLSGKEAAVARNEIEDDLR